MSMTNLLFLTISWNLTKNEQLFLLMLTNNDVNSNGKSYS